MLSFVTDITKGKVCSISTYVILWYVVNTIFRFIVFIIVPDQNPVLVNLILLSVDVWEEASLGMTWQHFFIILLVTIYLPWVWLGSDWGLAFNLLPLIKSPRPGYEFVCNFSKKYSGPTSFKSASIKCLLNTKGVDGFCSNVISIVSAE